MIELTESTSEPTTAPASGPDTPTSSVFCAVFAHLGLWGGMFVILMSLITQSPQAAVTALSAMLSSLPLFAIAAHLRQQAVTNHLLKKIANKK